MRISSEHVVRALVGVCVLLFVAACVLLAAGCTSIEVERKGQRIPTWTDTNGVVRVLCDSKGDPVILDGGWCVDYMKHWMWTRLDTLSATAGTGITLNINGYESGVDTNIVALVDVSLAGLTKLTEAVGEAYVKIAGGGAQADTTLKMASKVINYFRGKGGDVTKATVTSDEASGTFQVSDGSTCVQCDSAGNCTDCTK